MNGLNLDRDELSLVVGTFRTLLVNDALRPYFQEFIVRQLAESHPDLAIKVRGLDAEATGLLFRYVKDQQQLGRWVRE
jgi:hypothetical protein